MQKDDTFKLILKGKVYHIPSHFPQLQNVDQDIYNQLITTKQYKVKSYVDEEIFKSFLKHWTHGDTPIFNSTNIYEYIELSQEFDRMKDIISIYNKRPIKTDNPALRWKNTDLQLIYTRKSDTLNQNIADYQKILHFLFNNTSIDNCVDFSDIRAKLHFFCKKYNVEAVDFITRPKVKYENFVFALNEEEKTATLIHQTKDVSDYVIPRSVTYKTHEYLVTEISSLSGDDDYIMRYTLTIPSDTGMKTFYKKSFYSTHVAKLVIPSSLSCFNHGWCEGYSRLEEMKIYDNKKGNNITCYLQDFILGKTDLKSDIFDVFYYALRSVRQVVIPSHIKVISAFAFDGCNELEYVEFEPNSQLQRIEDQAFTSTGIDYIVIPPSVTKISCTAFEFCGKLRKVVIHEDSKLKYLDLTTFTCSKYVNIYVPSDIDLFYSKTNLTGALINIIITQGKEQKIINYNNDFVLGKTNPKSDIFDILLSARSDIKKAVVPSFIKIISPLAFSYRNNLKTVEFSEDSELQLIKGSAFYGSSIERIKIPRHVREVGTMAFGDCQSLKEIEFYEDSELTTISKLFCYSSSIERIKIPRHITKISKKSFKECQDLANFKISDQSELKTIENNAFYYCQIKRRNKTSSTNIKDYILLNKIGEGTYGKVHLVKNKEDKRIYAAKISRKLIDEETEELFRDISREVNIISKINHPCVVKFHFYSPINFKGKPKPVIITEYVCSGSLSCHIEHDRQNPTKHILTETLKLKIIYGIASAMSYLHSHDILHRDLKPDNILLDHFLNPKVADFGLSKSSNRRSFLSGSSDIDIKGTPLYMPPEIWNDGNYSKPGDVYSFSLILYELMTLERPFQGANFYNVLSELTQKKRPTFNCYVPDAYKDLITRCWSQEPSSRPTFDQILIELRTNMKFITETVNDSEYFDYIKFIDESKTSFDEHKNVIPTSNINIYQIHYMKDIETKKADDKIINIISSFGTSDLHFPFKYLKDLCKESLKIVKVAEKGDIDKQFEVGRNLIEGRFDFPIDVQSGLRFLKRSLKRGHRESLSYYIDLLLKGEHLPKNYEKAHKLVEILCEDESTFYLLHGKIFKKEQQYEEAYECFLQSMKIWNIESIYEYAKLINKMQFISEEQENSNNYYEEAISHGNLKAMYRYGFQLYQSKSLFSQEEGLKLIKQAADLGNRKAMFYYSTIIEGENDDKESESMKYLKRSADEGEGKSMNKYGVKLIKYLRSLPKEEDKSECIRYLKKACDKGFIESMYEYGTILYEDDNFTEKQAKEGTGYVRIAAEEGFGDALGGYASMLVEGKCVEVNIEEALKYYEKAISKGSAVAMNDYAFIHERGLGVEVDYNKAIKYYKMAIGKGYALSMNNYGHMLDSGIGVEVNYKEAIKYYKMAIDKGNELAMYNYAFMLENGYGGEVNYKEAIKYYKMAIDKGFRDAMTNYACMLWDGRGVEINYQEAIKYFKMAIKKGDPYSMYYYANRLCHGEGVEINYMEAIKYYLMSIDKDLPIAMFHYADMLQYGKGVERNYEEAIKYYKMAIDKGEPESMNAYGYMLLEGQGVKRDFQKAIKYFKMAIERGSSAAMFN